MNGTNIVIICGPTGIGKSALAMSMAHELNAEIVSADAGQVYRGFDIGTAKPTDLERSQVPHYCIDLWEPNLQSDAVLWLRAADRAIAEIQARGKIPLVVGGTGFYLRALLHGVFPSPDPDPQLRIALQSAYESEGGRALHERLQAVDPDAASRIHPNDPVRLVRALEFFEQTGKRISEERAKHRFAEDRYRASWIGLKRSREQLYAMINERVLKMMAAGWEREAEALYERWGGDVPAFRMIGYSQLRHYFAGELGASDLVPAIQQASRRYAKRQLTWFNSERRIVWLDDDRSCEAGLELCREALSEK